jgi:hypothetical protein
VTPTIAAFVMGRRTLGVLLCGETPEKLVFHTGLTNKDVSLGMDKPPRPQLPKLVVSNSFLESSTFPNKTCFLIRLPTELRFQIYRLLLLTPYKIKYPIADKLTIMLRPVWMRYGLYPVMLEACRFITVSISYSLILIVMNIPRYYDQR